MILINMNYFVKHLEYSAQNDQVVAAVPLAWWKKARNAGRKLLVCQPSMKNCLWLKREKINTFMYKFFLRAYDLNDKPDNF